MASKQAGGLPRNSPESKAGGELDDSRQVKEISDEQGGSPRWETTGLISKRSCNGHHAKTDTAESSDRFPSTGIEISDSNQAGLSVPLLTVKRDTKLHRLLPSSCLCPGVLGGFRHSVWILTPFVLQL